MNQKVLLIEDDAAIIAGIKEVLTAEFYQFTSESDGEKGFKTAKRNNFDLIILDLMLPGMNGIEICKKLRNEGVRTPILMLTSKKDETDKVLGLEIGADDYMTKPFSIKELLARVKALIRRGNENFSLNDILSFDGVTVDFKKHEVTKNNNLLKLSSMEFKILKYMLQHEGEIIERNKFLDDVWGYDAFPTTRTVDNFILSLRKKLEDDHSNPKHILTIHSEGYKFIK
jgi:DNA-binding response OmpR family regulator